jgi:hypothetical protein
MCVCIYAPFDRVNLLPRMPPPTSLLAPSRGLSRGVSVLTTLLHGCIRHVTNPTPSCGHLPALLVCPVSCPFRCASETPFFLPSPSRPPLPHNTKVTGSPTRSTSFLSPHPLDCPLPPPQYSTRKFKKMDETALKPHVPEPPPLPVEQWSPTHDLQAAGKGKAQAGERANARCCIVRCRATDMDLAARIRVRGRRRTGRGSRERNRGGRGRQGRRRG